MMEPFEEEPFSLWQDREIKFDSNDKYDISVDVSRLL